ncbi:Flavin prenyltransferase UbiX [Gammaproteobacteria bacterium]
MEPWCILNRKTQLSISSSEKWNIGDPIALAYTGASGALYGLRLLECLLTAGQRIYLMISTAARIVLTTETKLEFPESPGELEAFLGQYYNAAPGQLRIFDHQDWQAPLASGSNPPAAMVVCPCTMGTLAAIAVGGSDNLVERAADVCIKEGRRLILVPRETPLSVIHLENMLRLARLGVVILPPNPGFYHHPTSVADIVDFVVARILDHLRVEHQLSERWGERIR